MICPSLSNKISLVMRPNNSLLFISTQNLARSLRQSCTNQEYSLGDHAKKTILKISSEFKGKYLRWTPYFE